VTVTGAAPDAGPPTRREREVAALVAQGTSNRRIAAALVRSERGAGSVVDGRSRGRRGLGETWQGGGNLFPPHGH
jgi:FixJ family two-component response regulator